MKGFRERTDGRAQNVRDLRRAVTGDSGALLGDFGDLRRGGRSSQDFAGIAGGILCDGCVVVSLLFSGGGRLYAGGFGLVSDSETRREETAAASGGAGAQCRSVFTLS
jgi:hypothetical protein